MSAISLAVIGKNRQPIYLKEFRCHKNDDVDDDQCTDSNLSDAQLFGLESSSGSSKTSSSNTKKSDDDCSIRQQFILHDALDQMEQWMETTNSSSQQQQLNNSTNNQQQQPSAHDTMFAGLLCPIEDMRVYGYVTTTQIIFLLVVRDDADGTTIVIQDQRTIDETIKRLFIKLHRIYVEYILNPFTTTGIITNHGTTEIESQRFHQKVHDCIESYNHALMR